MAVDNFRLLDHWCQNHGEIVADWNKDNRALCSTSVLPDSFPITPSQQGLGGISSSLNTAAIVLACGYEHKDIDPRRLDEDLYETKVLWKDIQLHFQSEDNGGIASVSKNK
jgi:hypothetical protein